MHQRRSQAQYTYSLPSFDSNPNVGRFDLLGDLYNPGDLAAIRYADPVVAPLLNFVRKHLENLVWSVEPCEDTPEAIGAAEITNKFLTQVKFPFYAAQVWDLVHTFGFLYVERIWCRDEMSPLGFTAKTTPLFPPTISRIVVTPDGLRAARLEQSVDSGIQTFSGEEVLHYVSNKDIAGNLTGISGLRPLLFPFRASQVDNKVYLDARTRAAGLLLVKMLNDMDRGSREFEELRASLARVVAGESGYLILPPEVEAEMVGNDGARPPDGALENWRYYDSLKRAALGMYLENLGLNGSGSNRALGEVLADADNDRWQSQMRSLEVLLTEQGLLPEFYELTGIREDIRPHVAIRREDEIADIDDVLKRLNELADLQEHIDNAEYERLKREILQGRT
jgi:hypothetical protein